MAQPVPSPVPPGPANVRQRLIDWANSQDHWVRAIVAEALASRNDLSDKAIETIYDLLLAEKGLASGPSPTVAPLTAVATAQDAAEELRIARIKNVTGVNALAPNQEITLNPRLTVVFGENATGKTGYVRILKRLVAVRGAESILGNIRAASAPKPRATIEYALAGAPSTLEWNDEFGVPPFTRMSVFDSRAVAVHLDEDLTYVYTPGDLAVYRYTHRAIETIKSRLETQQAEAKPKANPFLMQFKRDATIYAKIEALGPTTSLDELKAHAALSTDDQERLTALRDRADSLRPESTRTRLQAAATEDEFFSNLLTVAGALRTFDGVSYNAAVARLQTAAENYRKTSELAFSADDIPGALRPAWRAFIQAGESFLQDIGQKDYPHPDDQCVYCRQALEPAAVALIKKYRAYANDASKRDVDAATVDQTRQAAAIMGLQLAPLQSTVAKRIESLADPGTTPPVLAAATTLLARAVPLQQALSKRQAVDTAEVLPIAHEVERAAAKVKANTEELIASLKKQATERQKVFEETSEQLRHLENRFLLQSLLPEIEVYVGRAKWASVAATISGRITPVMRALTEQSKAANEQVLNQDFERLFLAECQMLKAPPVKLDFAGRKGQAARRKLLSSSHRLSEILSEGEQKVIALADFLAEASLRTEPTPIIFDDPVNSLDYKRLQYVVERIVKLSETRQVIVFTHNIWFAVELLSHFESNKTACTYYGLTSDGAQSGIVMPGTHPRWDTVKSLLGRINQLMQNAGAVTGEAQEALLEKAYELIRSWCEVVVEQELLAGVTQRYQPNVMMTHLPMINADRLAAAINVLFPLYEKACRYMGGHSQPLETLSVRPTVAELKEDWKKAVEARETYLKK